MNLLALLNSSYLLLVLVNRVLLLAVGLKFIINSLVMLIFKTLLKLKSLGHTGLTFI
jgi:hypothetical protein